MKKIFVVLLVLFFVTSVHADENVNSIIVTPSCSGTYKVGDSFDVYVNVKGATESNYLSAFDGVFNYDKELFTLEGYSILENGWSTFTDGINSENKFMFCDLAFTNLLKKDSNVVKLTFKSKDIVNNATFNISSPTSIGPNEDSLPTTGGTCTINIAENVEEPSDNQNGELTQTPNEEQNQTPNEEQKQNPTTGSNVGIALGIFILMYFGIRFVLKRSKNYL